MLSQLRVYFATVTVVIFILMVAKIFDSKLQRFDIAYSWPNLLGDEDTSSSSNHNTTNTIKNEPSDRNISHLKHLIQLKVPSNLTFQTNRKIPEVYTVFENYDEFMGKTYEFHTENKSPFLKDEQYDFHQKHILNGGLNITRMAEHHIHLKMSPYEQHKMIGRPINDIRDLGDEMQSEMTLLNDTRRIFFTGESVAVRIDVYNARKVPKLDGGDEIRVWMKDQTKGVSMAVDVQDLQNGSYTASIPLLLPGNFSIFASLSYPREILRSIFFVRYIMRAVRLAAGGFVSKTASEMTLCSPVPIDYHGNGLCNLTQTNFNSSWYCGKPTNPSLTCEDWEESRDMEFPYPLPLGRGEKRWFDLVSSAKKHYLRAFRDSVLKIQVNKRSAPVKRKRHHNPSCGRRPPKETWTEPSPKGMFFKMLWLPFGCKLRRFSYKLLQQKLRGYRILLIGDSNLLSWVDVFYKNNLCTMVQNPINKVTGRLKTWHDPTECVNEKYNLTIRWRTHGLPFHSNPDHWSSRIDEQSVAYTLDQIPSTNIPTIIVIHLFMHFSTHHHDVYLDRIRATRDAIKRLLERNPSITVMIRGPHIAYREWPAYLGGDAQGPLFKKILLNEFKELYDKVYFLDFWDMTVAGENKEFHPTPMITVQMTQVFFGYAVKE